MSIANILWTLAGFVIGAIAGFFYTQLAMRPRLRLMGSGGGGAPSTTTLSITNGVGFQGLVLGETVLFGRLLWSRHQWGVNYERNPVEVTATITRLDESTTGGQGLSFLVDGTNIVSPTARIASGKSASVLVLTTHPGSAGRFFIFASEDGSTQARVPDIAATFSGPAEFEVAVRPVHGGKALIIQVAVVQDLQGNWHFTTKEGRRGRKGNSSSGLISTA